MIFLKKNLAYAKKLDTSKNKGQVKILSRPWLVIWISHLFRIL